MALECSARRADGAGRYVRLDECGLAVEVDWHGGNGSPAEGSLAAMHSQEPDALDNAIRWVRLLWDTPIRTGTRRYYDNFLYAFAFLALAGEYRVW